MVGIPSNFSIFFSLLSFFSLFSLPSLYSLFYPLFSLPSFSFFLFVFLFFFLFFFFLFGRIGPSLWGRPGKGKWAVVRWALPKRGEGQDGVTDGAADYSPVTNRGVERERERNRALSLTAITVAPKHQKYYGGREAYQWGGDSEDTAGVLVPDSKKGLKSSKFPELEEEKKKGKEFPRRRGIAVAVHDCQR